ncbi:MAG: hypothetical protein ACREVK_03105 [Gammaproteobacteria bacterium]
MLEEHNHGEREEDEEFVPTRIDLAAEMRGSMIALLNQHLVDTFDLSSQTKRADCGITH